MGRTKQSRGTGKRKSAGNSEAKEAHRVAPAASTHGEPPAGSAGRIEAGAAAPAPRQYETGMLVWYNSATFQQWMPAIVNRVYGDQVYLDIRDGSVDPMYLRLRGTGDDNPQKEEPATSAVPVYGYASQRRGESPPERRRKQKAVLDARRSPPPPPPPAAAQTVGVSANLVGQPPDGPGANPGFDLSKPAEKRKRQRDAKAMADAMAGNPSRSSAQQEQARLLAAQTRPELFVGVAAAAVEADPGHIVGVAIRDSLAGMKERKTPSPSGLRRGNDAAGVAKEDIPNARVFSQAIHTAVSNTTGPKAPVLNFLGMKGGTGKAQMRAAAKRKDAARASLSAVA